MKSKLFLIVDFVAHNKRHLFSSKCSQGGHSRCSGIVRKSRNPSRICKCPCHIEVVDQ